MCKVAQDKSETIERMPMACADEKFAVEFLEDMRWGQDAFCPRCGDVDVYQMTDSKTGERNSRFLWRCRGCKRQFTVRIGTVLEDSRIPLRHWCYAFWRAATSKKGVSALEIKRQTGLSYKSALFLMHRIRWAMAPTNDGPKLTGTVEVDETYVGGKPRYSQPYIPKKFRTEKMTNRSPYRKQPVFGAVTRGGEVRTRIIPDVTAHTLRAAVEAHVEKSARLRTDENLGYRKLGREFADHQTVRHSNGEYVRGDASTNTIESFWAILKRGINGIYHNVSRRHLQRYLDEFEFRYNHRKLEDGERTERLIKGAVGKRLIYADPVSA